MAAKTGTYTLINSTTLSSTQSAVTFSSIPATYTDLVLVCSLIGTASTSADVQFNGDTGSNYSYTVLDGGAGTASTLRQLNTTRTQLVGWSSNFGSSTSPSPAIMHVNDYSNTTTFKPVLVRSTAYGASTSCVDLFSGLWRNTSAINSITINASSFASGSTFKLYGIEAAK